jgi:zinc protease
MYQPGNCNIIIAGKADPQILEAVTQTFEGAWGEVTTSADTTQPELQTICRAFYLYGKS